MRVEYLKRGIIAAAAFAALAAAAAGAAETGAIFGFVTDEDGQPASGALVVVKGPNRYAITDADGYYVIQQVPVGTFDVKASRIDCGEQVKSGVKVIAGLRTNLSFQLESDPKPYYPFHHEEPVIEISPFQFISRYEEQIEAQVLDEFADILARPPGIVHENSDASTSDEDVRGGEVPPAGKAGDAGTGTISGLVTNQEGQPLNGALVVVIGANRYATTNADGYYSIQQVPPGTFDVKAMYAKHEEEETTVTVIRGFRTAVSFQLQQWFIFIY